MFKREWLTRFTIITAKKLRRISRRNLFKKSTIFESLQQYRSKWCKQKIHCEFRLVWQCRKILQPLFRREIRLVRPHHYTGRVAYTVIIDSINKFTSFPQLMMSHVMFLRNSTGLESAPCRSRRHDRHATQSIRHITRINCILIFTLSFVVFNRRYGGDDIVSTCEVIESKSQCRQCVERDEGDMNAIWWQIEIAYDVANELNIRQPIEIPYAPRFIQNEHHVGDTSAGLFQWKTNTWNSIADENT